MSKIQKLRFGDAERHGLRRRERVFGGVGERTITPAEYALRNSAKERFRAESLGTDHSEEARLRRMQLAVETGTAIRKLKER